MSADIRMQFERGECIHPYVPAFARVFIRGAEGVIIRPGDYGPPLLHKSDGRIVLFSRIQSYDGYWRALEPDDTGMRREVVDQLRVWQAAYDWCVRKARISRDGMYFMFTPGTPCCVRRPVCRTKPDSWWVPEFKGGGYR